MTNPRTEVMTARLRAHDGLMIASDLEATEQVSVFMVATILAARRVFAKLGVDKPGDGQRRKVIRNAIERDFAKKLLQYTTPTTGAMEGEPVMPEEPAPGGVT